MKGLQLALSLEAGGHVFTPADVAALRLWLKDPVAGSISNWVDSSGHAFSFTQGTPANQPTFLATGLNGKPALQSGSNSLLLSSHQTTDILTGTSAERHLVLIPDLTDNISLFSGWGASGQLGYIEFAGNIYDDFCSSTRLNFAQTLTAATAIIYSVTSGGGFLTTYINGTQVNQAANTFELPNPGVQPILFNGGTHIVAEDIFYNAISSAAVFAKTVAYLRKKFSI